jgi:hypothetical protein
VIVIVYRQAWTNLLLTLRAGHELALVDIDYVQDSYGIPGALSLRNTSTNTRYSVLMVEDAGVTPEIGHDTFRGSIPFASLPDGEYSIEGRVRDTLGQYLILCAFEAPEGTEETQEIRFTLAAGYPPAGERVSAPLSPRARLKSTATTGRVRAGGL